MAPPQPEPTPPPVPAPGEEFLKKSLYVFDLPPELLVTLTLKGSQPPIDNLPSDENARLLAAEPEVATATSCSLCQFTGQSVADQRLHAKSDFHHFNVKRRLRGEPAVSEAEFDKLLEELTESISGSDSDATSDSDDDPLSTLLRRKAVISSASQDGPTTPHKSTKGSAGRAPLIWFTSPLLPPEVSLGAYRALFAPHQQEEGDYARYLTQKQLSTRTTSSQSRHIFLCMIGGGHFAGMVVSLAPKTGKRVNTDKNERQVVVLAHKTFHRYTTRRKQGGSQSANDNAKGNAHSAGAGIRRHNEMALTNEVRELLASWRELIDTSELLFVRATGTNNRRTLFGYEGAVLKSNDSRIRGFPFSTRRATQSELMRSFVELTRLKVSRISEEALSDPASKPAQAPQQKPKPQQLPKLSEEEETALLHTQQLTALIRRSKAPALISYLSTNSLPPTFHLFPAEQHRHAPTPLHLAASLNSPSIVSALLLKASADPTAQNLDGKTPFELAGDRPTRDAFRVARHELGEPRWDWERAKVPAALSRSTAEERERRGKAERDKEEKSRRESELRRISEEQGRSRKVGGAGGKTLGTGPTVLTGVGAEGELRGLSAEARVRLERERRARAAEERIRRMQGR